VWNGALLEEHIEATMTYTDRLDRIRREIRGTDHVANTGYVLNALGAIAGRGGLDHVGPDPPIEQRTNRRQPGVKVDRSDPPSKAT
jgi:hypothetical protein